MFSDDIGALNATILLMRYLNPFLLIQNFVTGVLVTEISSNLNIKPAAVPFCEMESTGKNFLCENDK